jgi:hypothetical protein
MAFDRRSYLAGYRRGLQMARRELRQAERRFDDELADVRDELCATRHEVERRRLLDVPLEADERDHVALH